MVIQPLSIGDILMLSQTAWKIGRAFTQGNKSAPAEFAEVEREANGLSEALKLVAETLHTDGSLLSYADHDTQLAVNTILESAHRTLDDLDSFVDRYSVIKKKETNGGFVVERSWSEVVVANYKTLKWTTEGGDITALRNMLQMHTNSISLTMQALQSKSLARLEKTVVPMAEKITSVHDRVNGDLGDKIDDLHRIIMTIANSTPSLTARDRAIAAGGVRDSTSSVSTADRLSGNFDGDRLLEPAPLRSSSSHHLPPRQSSRSPHGLPVNVGAATRGRSYREDSAYYSAAISPSVHTNQRMDWDFETGSPVQNRRGSIGGCVDATADTAASPNDSAYAPLDSASRRESRARRESATLPALLQTLEERYDTAPGSGRVESIATSPRSARKWSKSPDLGGFLPPPAIPDDDQPAPQPATPASIFTTHSRMRSNTSGSQPAQRPQTARSVHRQSLSPTLTYTEGPKFERQLFRNAAILCDVRGKLVDYAQEKPGEPDPRYNVEMVVACQDARICVIRKRENRDHGGTKTVTSVWCLSDDGEVRLQHKLSEFQETVPYCSYFDPEKVSLQSTDSPISMRFHSNQWAGPLKEDIKTNWVNYYFASENDAVSFQSAVFGRMLVGSYRTTKTTVIHDGIKGAFAFEEQFANIEMLRLWQEDGVSTPGAQGGVLALMHISSNFGEGWARWWINNSSQQVRIKGDGAKHAKVKGIDVTVVRPGRMPSSAGEGHQQKAEAARGLSVKYVNGVKIEFKTEEERARFVGAAKKAQERTIPLPPL